MQRGMYNAVTEVPVLIPCEYARRDGMVNLAPPNATLGGTLAGLHPVRALRDADFDRNSDRGKKFWGKLPADDRNRLLALIGLWQALEADDPLSVEKREEAYLKVMHELLSPTAGLPQPARENFQTAMARLFAQRGKSLGVLERILTDALHEARLILWRQEKSQRLFPAIYCPDAATAVYVCALVRIAGGRAFRVCPNCGNPFVQQRTDQDYCSIHCREAHRVARWRAQKRRSKPKRRKRP